MTKKKTIVITTCIVLLVALIASIVVLHKRQPVNIPIDSKEAVAGTAKAKAVINIKGMIDYVRQGNGYFKVINGKDSSDTYVYNSHGEAVAQASDNKYLTVFKSQSTSVRFADTVVTEPDIDILKLSENALGLVTSGKATMERPEAPVIAETNFYTYYVTVKGWANIHKLYESVSTTFADTMVKNMQASVPNGKDIELQFKYVLGNKKELSEGCNLIMDGKTYTLWYFDGYLLLYDWKLPDDWYNFDFKDDAKSQVLLTGLLKNLGTMFDKYAVDNKLPTKEQSEAAAAAKAKNSAEASSNGAELPSNGASIPSNEASIPSNGASVSNSSTSSGAPSTDGK